MVVIIRHCSILVDENDSYQVLLVYHKRN